MSTLAAKAPRVVASRKADNSQPELLREPLGVSRRADLCEEAMRLAERPGHP